MSTVSANSRSDKGCMHAVWPFSNCSAHSVIVLVIQKSVLAIQ